HACTDFDHDRGCGGSGLLSNRIGHTLLVSGNLRLWLVPVTFARRARMFVSDQRERTKTGRSPHLACGPPALGYGTNPDAPVLGAPARRRVAFFVDRGIL